jgi:hypothetical protein
MLLEGPRPRIVPERRVERRDVILRRQPEHAAALRAGFAFRPRKRLALARGDEADHEQ